MLDSDNNVVDHLKNLKAGSDDAARALWERYAGRLQRLADRRLGAIPRRASDEEDVVVSAFNSFCRRAVGGKFPQLETPEDLWKLLATITARKAASHREREQARKRGGGVVRSESAFDHARPDSDRSRGIENVSDRQLPPDRRVELAEQFDTLLDRLQDPVLRRIALFKLAGYRNDEIASELDVSLSSVERKLRCIRLVWSNDFLLD
ncbi:RNA polymerase sigma factor [Planctomycetes bacterium Pan216]|uniref:RNA polymerase sigma factor n=1 Tax=Kolteria novifilia TaxID=2527975 RepID=A0A518B7Q0_9BACT|nr:RNA polymerase sigma factor [Planctomycetes bacterium Pan216]